jgi:hypothetical protein
MADGGSIPAGELEGLRAVKSRMKSLNKSIITICGNMAGKLARAAMSTCSHL